MSAAFAVSGSGARQSQTSRTENGGKKRWDSGTLSRVSSYDQVFSTLSSATITVEPSADDEPESVLFRAVLLKKNKEVGQPSDILPVTIFPL